MREQLRALVGGATVVLAGAIAIGCGGGSDELTLEEYFQQFERLGVDMDRRADETYEKWVEEREGATSDEERVRLFRDFINENYEAATEVVEDLSKLDPPAEAEELHDQIVNAATELQEMGEVFVARIQDLQSLEDVEEIGAQAEAMSPAADKVEQRLGELCFALQDVADAHQVDIDLECGRGWGA